MVLLPVVKKMSFESLAEECYPSPTVLDKTHHHWHMALAPYVQLGIPNACQVRRARKPSCWLPQEHTQVDPLHIPSRIMFLNCFPAMETWDQALWAWPSALWAKEVSASTPNAATFFLKKPSKKRAVPVSSGQLFGVWLILHGVNKRRKGDL